MLPDPSTLFSNDEKNHAFSLIMGYLSARGAVAPTWLFDMIEGQVVKPSVERVEKDLGFRIDTHKLSQALGISLLPILEIPVNRLPPPRLKYRPRD